MEVFFGVKSSERLFCSRHFDLEKKGPYDLENEELESKNVLFYPVSKKLFGLEKGPMTLY